MHGATPNVHTQGRASSLEAEAQRRKFAFHTQRDTPEHWRLAIAGCPVRVETHTPTSRFTNRIVFVDEVLRQAGHVQQ